MPVHTCTNFDTCMAGRLHFFRTDLPATDLPSCLRVYLNQRSMIVPCQCQSNAKNAEVRRTKRKRTEAAGRRSFSAPSDGHMSPALDIWQKSTGFVQTQARPVLVHR